MSSPLPTLQGERSFDLSDLAESAREKWGGAARGRGRSPRVETGLPVTLLLVTLIGVLLTPSSQSRIGLVVLGTLVAGGVFGLFRLLEHQMRSATQLFVDRVVLTSNGISLSTLGGRTFDLPWKGANASLWLEDQRVEAQASAGSTFRPAPFTLWAEQSRKRVALAFLPQEAFEATLTAARNSGAPFYHQAERRTSRYTVGDQYYVGRRAARMIEFYSKHPPGKQP